MKNTVFSSLSCLSLTVLVRIVTPTAPQLILSPSSSESNLISSDPDTSNFIFASFAGLLQQWPNSFAYSGHSIIPGIIPRSTLLYHGTNQRQPPPEGMEWLAFNPEMSYAIHSSRGGQLDLYTYVTTRPLRVIYIDGQSASLGTPGFMDSQSVLINGTVNKEFGDEGHRLEAEYARANALCNIGEDLGFEGVVRMNTGFELIWCDFKQGIDIIRVTNATYPISAADGETGDHSTSNAVPLSGRAFWNFAQAASRQYFAPGEVRVILDPTGFISFYDRLESLALKRRADGTNQGPRSRHRLYGIDSTDVEKIRDRLISVLARKNKQGWQLDSDQVDWRALVLTIVQTYTQPLKELNYVLKRGDLSAIDQAIEVRSLSLVMLMPYVDFSSRNLTDPAWASQTIKKCSTAFTSGIYHPSDLTESIRVIIGAIEGTLNQLCSTVYAILSQTMEMSLPSTSAVSLNSTLEIEARAKIIEWDNKAEELISWLGWTWGQCSPSCKPNEQCMIPMWPVVKADLTNFTDTFVCRNFSTWTNMNV